ncbi:30S ribosomal protein S10, chloroplastic, partial [Mucuna pruriens]
MKASNSMALRTPKPLHLSTSVNAAPEALVDESDSINFEVGSLESWSSTSSISIGTDAMILLGAPYRGSCKQILDAARTTNAKSMGPVPLPTKKRVYCVLKSPHIRTHQRLIDILYPTAQTIDSLMQLDLPAVELFSLMHNLASAHDTNMVLRFVRNTKYPPYNLSTDWISIFRNAKGGFTWLMLIKEQN